MAPPNDLNVVDDSRSQKKRVKKKADGITTRNQAPIPPPKKSLVRKRLVSFGNPALGTYYGCLYTLDVIGADYSSGNRPIIEGAESVQRIVAMVDVPPQQVPEGILNLARSHRAYVYHIRIVIAEINEEELQAEPEEKSPVEIGLIQVQVGQLETKDKYTSFDANPDQQLHSTSFTVSAVKSAASIIAADELHRVAPNANSAANTAAEDDKGGKNNIDATSLHKMKDNTYSASSRTYLVIFELCSMEAAENFIEDLHGKPYTSLDPTQKCSVHRVLSWTGDDGVSLLSPLFVPTARSESPRRSESNTAKITTIVSDGFQALPLGSAPETGSIVPATPSPSAASAAVPPPHKHKPPSGSIVEDYNCAVCLEHMILSEAEYDDSDASKIRSSILTTVCNHSFHMDCLLKWQDSPCPVCRYDHSGLNDSLSQCHKCGRTENNYVCLICGVVSCGGPPTGPQNGVVTASSAASDRPNMQVPVWLSTSRVDSNRGNHGNTSNTLTPSDHPYNLPQSHARSHYDQTLHAYALDTETQHVWDFAGEGYVHRLLQNKEDGKLVEFHDPCNTSSQERSLTPGLSNVQEGEVIHRKLEGFASQYYTLLKSQLEQQRIYYQGRLEELRRESLMRKKAETCDLINALKQEKAQLSGRAVSLKARHCRVVEETAFLKNMIESLKTNKEILKRKVKEAKRQRIIAQDQLQQRLFVLEQKVAGLLQELTGDANMENHVDHGHRDDVGSGNLKTLHPSNIVQSDDRKPSAQR